MRFAMNALKNTGNFLIKNMGDNPAQIAFRVVPDIGFGVLAGVQTPGDLSDKLIAGGTQAAGGVLGGITTGGAVKGVLGRTAMNPKAISSVADLADLAGSVGGDFAGMMVGDNLQRAKDKLMGGQGLTSYERMSAEEQAQYAEILKQQILAQYGLIPGTREQFAMPYTNPSTGMGVA